MRCCVLLALAGCGFSPSASTHDGNTGSGGSDASGSGSRTLTVALGNANELDDFPLLVLLDSTRVDYADVPDPTTGFTFTDPSGATLDYDVDHWDPTGQSALWVRVPMIPTTGTILTMAFGSGQHQSQALATWSGFQQVLHFDTSALTDSSGRAFAPIPHSVTAQPGQIASAGGFATTSQVGFGDGTQLYNGWSDFTLDFWLYLDYDSQPTSFVTIMNRGGPLQSAVYSPLNSGDFAAAWSFGVHGILTVVIPMSLKQWTHIAMTWDGATMTGWADGHMEYTMPAPGGATSLASDPTVDSFTLGPGFQGSLDELELDRDVAHRAPDWIPAEYRSQTDHAIAFSP